MLGSSRVSVTASGTGRAGGGHPTISAGRFRLALWGLLGIGLLGRAVLAFSTRGNVYDLQSALITAHALLVAPGHVYQLTNDVPGGLRFPYPPGFFPLILACKGISGATGLAFTSVVRFPSILADIGIAWVVQDHLRARGHGFGPRLGAVALVTLSPSFAAISGVHGQIDALAILPAVIALSVWERARPSRRALIAGLLIGAGAAVKSVPLLMLLALLPTACSRREALTLVLAALALPAVAVAPWVLHDGLHWFHYLNYNGAMGLGGISLIAQPDLALNWFHVGSNPLTRLSLELYTHARWIAAVAVLAVGAVIYRRRVAAPLAAVLLWLTIYAFGVNFFMQYMVWGLPFLLLAGYLRPTLALEAMLLAPVLITYHGVRHAAVAVVFYVVPMICVWAACTALVLLWCSGRPRSRRAVAA